MRKSRYLIALIPLVAIWVYAITQSAGQFFATIETARINVPATQPVDSSADRGRVGENLTQTADPTELVPAGAGAPEIEPEHLADARDMHEHERDLEASRDSATHADEHPDITDPRIRRLLQPAWDD
jgi:hypothetical protein